MIGFLEYVFFGKVFIWICVFLKFKEISINYVLFKRNVIIVCVGIGYINGVCWIDSYIFNYIYKCLLENIYFLKILVDNMIKDENNL